MTAVHLDSLFLFLTLSPLIVWSAVESLEIVGGSIQEVTHRVVTAADEFKQPQGKRLSPTDRRTSSARLPGPKSNNTRKGVCALSRRWSVGCGGSDLVWNQTTTAVTT
ncbi:hypothetical protein JOB18_043943 [Solea senegalensis]|uniref:Secreted protein n=1 Tax=Solea senegalensis TaxID=28829 RepID=A0AAV6S2Z9_SOLSE|nr:hypothetical protein JOB18_043943 [Solea senegalensis]